MSSASKTLVINTRERAISNDIMRLQQFLSADLAEFMRYSLLANGTDSSGVVSVPSTSSVNNYVITNGFLVRPVIHGTALSVDPGVAFVVSPDALPSTDDSPVKMIVFDGTNPLPFGFVANASGSDRIDVLEFMIAEASLESTSRDIYNPTSGLFNPATVTKVTRHVPLFRLRQGTPGSGFPGVDNDYHPIAVFRVPHSATNWDGCTIWDVRRLASEVVNHSTVVDHVSTKKRYHDGIVTTDGAVVSGATSSNPAVVGTFTSELNGRKIGGTITNSNPLLPTGAQSEPGFVASIPSDTNAYPWYLYGAFPYGLPRWCQYDNSTMLPGGFKGIAIATRTPPHLLGDPSSGLTLPTATGLVGSTTNATILISGMVSIPISAIEFSQLKACRDGTVNSATLHPFPQTTSYSGNAMTTNIVFDASTNHRFPEDAIAIHINAIAGSYTCSSNRSNARVLFSTFVMGEGGLGESSTCYADVTSGYTLISDLMVSKWVLRSVNYNSIPSYKSTTVVITLQVDGQTISTGNHSAILVGWKSY